jgi:predicted RNase H-like HicB family nuclease
MILLQPAIAFSLLLVQKKVVRSLLKNSWYRSAIAIYATVLVGKSDNVVIDRRVLDETMILLNYCEKALQQAQYKKLDDGTWFAEIEGFEGVWGNGLTVEECRQDLLEVLEEWIILKLQDGDPLPVMDGVAIKVTEVVEV